MSSAPVHFYHSALVGHASPEEAARRLVADPRNPQTAVCWALRPWTALCDRGLPVRPATRLPAADIVVAPRCELAWSERPSPELLPICARADGGEHPWAQLELVQNPAQAAHDARVCMPHWSQPGIRPRDLARGGRFKRVAYLGSIAKLQPELLAPAWTETLRRVGLTWIIRHAGQDDLDGCQDIDAIVAPRDFGVGLTTTTRTPRSSAPGASGGPPSSDPSPSTLQPASEAVISWPLKRPRRCWSTSAPCRSTRPAARAAYFARRQLRPRWRTVRARFGVPSP